MHYFHDLLLCLKFVLINFMKFEKQNKLNKYYINNVRLQQLGELTDDDSLL